MKLVELLEKDKENLLTELAAAKEPDRAIRVLENELDKLLMTYNEQADSERERDAAAYMMQAVRLSLPLVDSVGETKVWETGSVVEERKTRMWPLVIVLLIVAIVLCGVGLLPLVMDLGGIEKVDYVKQGPMLLGGLAAAFIAGLLPRRSAPKKTKAGQRVETNIDPNKVYISFRNALLAVDQNLEEIQSVQRWEKREEAGKIDGHVVSDSELDIFSDLLTASYSKDPEYALEKIENIKYYLHKQQIEAVDYSAETAQFFDMMPSQRAGTIRPALVADGKLLRKGMASTGSGH